MAQLYGTSVPCVEVKDMEAEVFRAMLRFIYTDTAPELERSGWQATAQHLLEAADRYRLERLKRMCEEKVSTNISMSNVATTMALAEQHGCAKLKASYIEFILAAPENLCSRCDGRVRARELKPRGQYGHIMAKYKYFS
ncbi:BTB/POZ and MATH domain-containing protein 1-like [Miscanthus floridulus]|uniref:BTB/POZ and MATH domain-containing protein 1-like n=1 Tax=Miscanthus floridulus TaxID=154761 RepID=UPI00345778FF